VSVDAVGAGAGFDLVAVAGSSDLAGFLAPVGEVGLPTQAGLSEGSDSLPSVADFEAVMLAASELCGEVIAEVSGHSLVGDTPGEVRDDFEETVSDLNGGIDGGYSPADFGFGPLPSALVDLIKSATPAQLAEMCSDLEGGIGLPLGRAVNLNAGASEHHGDGRDLGRLAAQDGQDLKPSTEVSTDQEGVVQVQRVVGRDSDVIVHLSRGIMDAARDVASSEGANEVLLGAPRMREVWKQVFSNVSVALERGSGQEAGLESTQNLNDSSTEGAVRLSQKQVPSFGLEAGLESKDGVTGAPLARMADVTLAVAARQTLQLSERGVSFGDLSNATQMLAGGAGKSQIPDTPVASLPVLDASGRDASALTSGESSGEVISGEGLRDFTREGLQSFRSGEEGDSTQEKASPNGGRSDLVAGVPRERSASDQDRGAETAGRESGGRGGKSPSQEIAVGWHGRKVVAEPLSTVSGQRQAEFHLRGATVGEVELNQQGEIGQIGGDGTSSMTAFTLVQRSVGFHRGAGVGEARAGQSASNVERVAGEVWSRLADSVARVRADRGALRVEIELPQGMSVEVELRGVSGGVNAVFRVGDSGLRQTLETMWSVLPRSEKVSALDLTDVSFERGSSRGSGDLDSRGGREGAEQGRQERFEGDVRDFEGKSSEKKRRLGTPEATKSPASIASRGFRRVE
jgi:hypothetical protein